MKKGLFKLFAIAVIVMMLATTVGGPANASKAPVPDARVYIIRLQDVPLASYRGGVSDLAPTSPAATGKSKLDVNSPASVAYRAYLAEKQAQLIATMEQSFGHKIEVLFQYDVAYNGMAVRLTAQEAGQVAALPGVANVQPDFVRYPTTDAGPAWIGAPGIWDGSDTGGLPGTKGEGIIAGIIDTGQNLGSPSFADVGQDGYDHTNPLGAGNYKGLCASAPGTWVCNDKFIGYYIYTGENHEDENGHGSHTASTVAGNVVLSTTAVLNAPTTTYAHDISGVAPHANLIGYDACIDTSGCPGSALIAAINQATADGVDVINYSIGGGASNPWLDADALAFLAAEDAGIVPVTSAGNNGPGPGTVGSPADAPWMLAVGAISHNRYHRNSVVDMDGGSTPPPADILGKGLTAGYGIHPIVYAGDFGDAQCQNPFPAGTWHGEIVVCDRGVGGRVAKGANVLAGGAGGYVLANDAANGRSLNGDPHVLPAVHITYEDGVALKAWLASGSGHVAAIAGYTASFDPANGDIVVGFSSRGPTTSVPDVIKPDVTAPGLDVFAAYRDPEEYWIISGTSMSSPHAAGAAALLTALHPNWSPAQIKSALMTTAWTATVVKEDEVTPADPFDIGGGRVDLSKAGQPGLVLDISTAEFQNASPTAGGDPKTLNLSSMANSECADVCSWTRVVSSTLASAETWTASVVEAPGMTLSVTPNSFSLGAFATQTVTVTADVNGLPLGDWVFGQVILTPGTGTIPEAHFPVAVAPSAGPPDISVDPASLESRQPADDILVQPLTISNSGDSPLDWTIYEDGGVQSGSPQLVDWFENFDSYATGSQMHGQGGWKGWGNSAAAGALTTNLYARSAPNSVDILGASDLVHEYSGYTTGFWRYTAWQYIPTGFSGESYFILLNQYDDAGATNNWSTQVHFNAAQNLVIADGVGSGQTLPLIKGQWVEIRVEIDLINDNQEFYYDGQLLYEGSWRDGVSGGGILNIGAVDLFANGASSVYYDDLSLVETTPEVCDLVHDMPWLSVSPEGGTTQPAESSMVDVTFDSTGLDLGTYTGNLCITSNDPIDPLVVVPVTMTVVPMDLELSPAAQTLSGAPGEVVTHTFTLTNTGGVANSYALSVSGNRWPTSVMGNTGEVGPGASVPVDVVVNIPADPAVQGVPVGSDTFTLTAVSGLEPNVMAQASGTTIAEATPMVSLGGDQADSGPVGADVVYTFPVTNQGDYTDTFTLALSGGTWPSMLSVTTTLALGPGASQDVLLTVGIPTTAAPGATDVVTITATSELDAAVSDSATATTTAMGHKVYLPIVVKNY
jgi:hypothetical protein